ncbi:NADP-dependent oxidoreductase [Paenibacillus sp. PK1-4R]|uniref:NADP-dependent oxidoreductase n=1 Tax=Paenibacillus sp. PK1-4R TaxID=3049075 RepID=UPI0020538C18|nr:NADP-dependent oxidoreductase [Paenibacillus sp. PK1-4R]UOK66276.1 NADP-dependent oxidoreductase [Paenibacillus sp. OVF10]WJM06987.1 NADP-dependent oxidoreductase [Paenibacillus sp. PK1-4R]
MKAIVIEEFGGAEQLKEKEVAKPTCGVNQVLIRTHATSVNPVDFKIRQGDMKEAAENFPLILGGDVAGIVAEAGSNVTRFREGDRVFARPRQFGTYAEYVAVDADIIARIPENLSFEEAAAIPLAAMTAWQALVDHGRLGKGQKVLIHAGAGGVGTYAIQIAKSLGAEVASTASESNEALLRSLGVDHFINYKKEDFSEILSGYDVVLDTMGGDIQRNSFKVLKSGGHLVSLVEQPDEKLAKKAGVTANVFMMEPKGDQLDQLAELAAEGKLKSVIDGTYPLTQQGVREAHEKSETHHSRGKLVIQVQ